LVSRNNLFMQVAAGTAKKTLGAQMKWSTENYPGCCREKLSSYRVACLSSVSFSMAWE